MKKKKDKSKKKKKYIDTGVTIANMNVEGMRWYKSSKEIKRKKEVEELGITKKERWAMIKGAFLAYLPIFLLIILGFGLAFLLIFLIFLH